MTAEIRPALAPAHPRARALILLATVSLALAGCSDPGIPSGSGSESAGTGAPVPGTPVVQTFNLDPEQHRPASDVSADAASLVPEAIAADGKLTVAVTPNVPPLASYATDNATVIGSEADMAYALGDALGLEVEIVPTAWADWPLGVESGKYEAALSNITVTEARREKFDFATYRNDQLGFYAQADSTIGPIENAADVAGKRVIVGSGTNQELILLAWDRENRTNGREPVRFQYYDDDSAASLALQSGRADLTFGPNATAAYKAAVDGRTKLVGQVNGGWPLTAQVAVTTARGERLRGSSSERAQPSDCQRHLRRDSLPVGTGQRGRPRIGIESARTSTNVKCLSRRPRAGRAPPLQIRRGAGRFGACPDLG